MAKKLSVINFKGGVGKTTLAFHLAAYFARENKVLVIDVDHQSSLSIVMLGGNLWEERAQNGQTINRVFESYCNRKVSMPQKEIIFVNPLHARSSYHDNYPNLDLVPAQFELDDTEIELAATSIGGPTVSEWEKRTLLANWLDEVGAEKEYDYIIFDCPPATKLVSQNALAASDFYLIPVIPDEMSSRGVTHFKNLVENKIDGKLNYLKSTAGVSASETPKSYVPVTKIAGIVAFMAKPSGAAYSGLTNLHTRQINNLRRQWKDEMLKTVVKHMTGFAEAMDSGWPIWDTYVHNATPALKTTMTKLCKEIENRI